MSSKLLPFDERANIFPLMQGDEFDELVGDIKRRGLLDPIDIYNGKIIDGRNRARACENAGIEPQYKEFQGKDDDVTRYIISKNIHRRHLKPEQRRETLKRLLRMYPEQSDRAIAAIAKVSPTTVGTVRANVQTGHKDRVEKFGRKARGRKPGSKKGRSPPSVVSDVSPLPEKRTSNLPTGLVTTEKADPAETSTPLDIDPTMSRSERWNDAAYSAWEAMKILEAMHKEYSEWYEANQEAIEERPEARSFEEIYCFDPDDGVCVAFQAIAEDFPSHLLNRMDEEKEEVAAEP
jgi:hypothetical protein